jgi:hypothetical protein
VWAPLDQIVPLGVAIVVRLELVLHDGQQPVDVRHQRRLGFHGNHIAIMPMPPYFVS